jgi:hypothetical protein
MYINFHLIIFIYKTFQLSLIMHDGCISSSVIFSAHILRICDVFNLAIMGQFILLMENENILTD